MDPRDLRPPAGGVLVMPMSREDFDALPEIPHTEWWDGALVMTGTTNRHGRAAARLCAALIAALAGRDLDVGTGTGWRLPDAEFAPDVVVTGPAPDDQLLTEPPLLVVEILSRSTRHIDLGRKREIYAAGGLAWYWIVDLVKNELIVFRNVGGAFAEVGRFATGTTEGPVSIEVAVADL